MAITPLMPVYPRSPVRPVRGEGVYLYGEQGEKYLDFAAASRSIVATANCTYQGDRSRRRP